MERTRLAKASIEELKGKRREAEIRKKYFENYLKKLHESYASGKISFSFYVETLHLHRDGRDIKGWIEYYEHYIRECERLIKKHKKNIAKTRIPIIALSFIALVFVILFLSQSALQFTGFAVQEDQEIAADPGINATINTFQQQAVLGQPVKWIKTISLNIPSDIRLNLPKEAEDIQIIKSYSGENSEEVFPNQTSPFQEKSSSSSETNIGFSMTGAVISETGGKSRILNFFRRITRLTGFAVQQESNQQIGIEINETNTTEYEISYETPAPQSSEKDIEKGKRITIISPKNLHYENVLAFTNLSENLNIRNPSQIKIHWLENNTYVESSSVQDKNNNGIYDYVEWIVPHLSEQTFEIIVITKAEHLDSNMKFISDIYNEVRELDNIWSESINDGEHVRVTFEKNLTNSNDITIYPRVISGNPYIEVYEKDKTKKIATFNSLTSNEYNKVILTNLQNSQDTFDLKVISGSVEFDHIIDPTSELVISGGTVELCGNEARYDKILVTSTGILQICARNATVNTGWLNISLGTAGNFTVESGGIITGQGRGGRGGAAYTGNSGNGTQGENGNNWTAGAAKTLPNGGGGGGGGRTVNTASAGGGGGGFGGKGGLGGMQTGIRSSAGNSYGSTSDVTLLGGSGGGGAATDGGGTGAGGGAGLKIDVGIGVIKINGNISLIGNVGIAGSSTDQGAGGGGSGGHLILSGSSINLNSAKLNVTGGRGGNAPGAGTDDCGGGGGGGGIIYIVYSTMSNTSVTTEAKGAGGGTSYCATAPTAGSLGNVTYNFTTATFPDNLPQWSNPNVNNSNPATEAVVIHNVSWTDDGELSLAILEVNGTGAGCDTTANVSSIDIAGSYNQSNLTWVIPSACAGKAIGWRQWGFDFPNNQSNVTSTQIYVVQADNPPAYFFPSTNETSPLPNRAVSYNVNWTDTGTLSAAILEINSTGANCDTTANVSQTSLAGSSAWANITWLVPNACEGKLIGWKQYSNDTLGNMNITSLQTYSVQEVNPTASFGTNPVANYNSTSQSVTFELSVADNLGVDELSLYGNWTGAWHINQTNATPINNSVWSIVVNGIPEGKNHLWGVRGNDTLGNSDFTDTNRTFTVDATPPVITLPICTNATKYKNTQTMIFNISVVDALIGASYCAINVGGAANQTLAVSSGWCNGTYALTGISDGNQTINVYANDTLGNMAINKSYAAWIDSTAPAITLPIYTNATVRTTEQNLILNISVIDAGVGTSYCAINIGGAANQTLAVSSGWCNISYSLSGSAEGNQTINVYANDTMGNAALNNSYVVQIDNAPKSTGNSTNSTKAGQLIEHRILWTDTYGLSGYIFSFDNGTGTFVNDSFVSMTGTSNWSNITKSVNSTVGLAIRWKIYANDSVNNSNATVIFVYDTTLANEAPTIPVVQSISATDPTIGTTTAITFNFTANDNNGADDINASSAQAQFLMNGETTRSNTSCTSWASAGNNVNFTCTIDMWYFDQNGAWTVNVSVKDNLEEYAENSSTTFTYNIMTAMVMSPSSVNWPTINLLDTDTGSSDDPITINNSGNDINLNINITAYNLRGVTTPTEFIYANNFTIQNASQGCSGTAMVNQTSTNVTSAILQRGNNTLNYYNETSGQEQIYFCLKGVPHDISSQSYSSSAYGSWEIRILLVALIPRKKKKEKVEKDNLFRALNLILDEIKEEYSLNKKEMIEILTDKLRNKYQIGKKEIFEIIREKEIRIPVSIFSKELGALESLTKYMKENLNMSYKQIADEISRDERTIWTSYKKAQGKHKEKLEIKKTEGYIPMSAFENKKLTILESVIIYLKNKKFKFSEIAKMLKRDQRNIWTVYSRAKGKKKQD